MRSLVWMSFILFAKFLCQWAQGRMVSPCAYVKSYTSSSQQDEKDKDIGHLANSSILVVWLSALIEAILSFFLNKYLFLLS